jgi:hypothetical protein
MQSSSLSSRGPWAMLPARFVLFFLFQALFAAGFLLTGATDSWNLGAAWWPFSVTLTNLVCLFLLTRLFRQEGKKYWDLFRIDRAHVKGDLLLLLGLIILSAPVAFLPNILIATALYGNTTTPLHQFLLPLPMWAIIASIILFPATQGLAELATYFMYVMPRLSALTQRPWLAYVLASFFLGIQHSMVPLIFDGRFIAWRALMYIPFAFLMGIVLKWRPRMLPYLAIVHVLMDISAVMMYLIPM